METQGLSTHLECTKDTIAAAPVRWFLLDTRCCAASPGAAIVWALVVSFHFFGEDAEFAADLLKERVLLPGEMDIAGNIAQRHPIAVHFEHAALRFGAHYLSLWACVVPGGRNAKRPLNDVGWLR